MKSILHAPISLIYLPFDTVKCIMFGLKLLIKKYNEFLINFINNTQLDERDLKLFPLQHCFFFFRIILKIIFIDFYVLSFIYDF